MDYATDPVFGCCFTVFAIVAFLLLQGIFNNDKKRSAVSKILTPRQRLREELLGLIESLTEKRNRVVAHLDRGSRISDESLSQSVVGTIEQIKAALDTQRAELEIRLFELDLLELQDQVASLERELLQRSDPVRALEHLRATRSATEAALKTRFIRDVEPSHTSLFYERLDWQQIQDFQQGNPSKYQQHRSRKSQQLRPRKLQEYTAAYDFRYDELKDLTTTLLSAFDRVEDVLVAETVAAEARGTVLPFEMSALVELNQIAKFLALSHPEIDAFTGDPSRLLIEREKLRMVLEDRSSLNL